MSNTQRPSLQRKDTRKTADTRRAALEQGVRITIDDVVHEIRLGDITPVLARRFRTEYGAPFSTVLDELETSTDIDTIAGVLWMSRLLAGDDVAFDEIAFGYGDLDGLAVEEVDAATEPAAEVDRPEA